MKLKEKESVERSIYHNTYLIQSINISTSLINVEDSLIYSITGFCCILLYNSEIKTVHPIDENTNAIPQNILEILYFKKKIP